MMPRLAVRDFGGVWRMLRRSSTVRARTSICREQPKRRKENPLEYKRNCNTYDIVNVRPNCILLVLGIWQNAVMVAFSACYTLHKKKVATSSKVNGSGDYPERRRKYPLRSSDDVRGNVVEG